MLKKILSQAPEEGIKLKFHQRGSQDRDKYLGSKRDTVRPGGTVRFSEGRVTTVFQDVWVTGNCVYFHRENWERVRPLDMQDGYLAPLLASTNNCAFGF